MELMVSVSICLILMVIIVQITSQTGQVWRSSKAKVESFQEARAAFESLTRNLRQATLNTYYDYYDASWKRRGEYSGTALQNFVPTRYDRVSELHFICGPTATLLPSLPPRVGTETTGHAVFFQAPLGYSTAGNLANALNATGYFVAFGEALDGVPQHFAESNAYTPRYRYRLMQVLQPAEKLAVYEPQAAAWYQNAAASHSHVLAENVVALAILPMLPEREDTAYSLSPNYSYDSRVQVGSQADSFTTVPPTGLGKKASRHHQLPPIIRVAMVAVDEASMNRLQGSQTTPAMDFSNLFTTASEFDADLERAERKCQELGLTYRVFSTNISLREAQWSID